MKVHRKLALEGKIIMNVQQLTQKNLAVISLSGNYSTPIPNCFFMFKLKNPKNGFPVMMRPDDVIIVFVFCLFIFFSSICFIDDLIRQDQHRNAIFPQLS